MLKKIASIISGVVVLLMPAVVFAQYGLKETASKIGYSKSASIYSILNTVVGTALGLIGFVFFGMMMYAGFRWMTARGNEELVEKAKHTLQAAIIGMAIVVASYGITTMLFNSLLGSKLAPQPASTAPKSVDCPGDRSKCYLTCKDYDPPCEKKCEDAYAECTAK